MSDDYDKKLRDMQKYVPFLENLIQNLKKSHKHDEKREAQLNKMQMFYELLTNKNKKLKLETLERCEQVLVKLHQKAEKMKIDIPLATELSIPIRTENKARSETEVSTPKTNTLVKVPPGPLAASSPCSLQMSSKSSLKAVSPLKTESYPSDIISSPITRQPDQLDSQETVDRLNASKENDVDDVHQKRIISPTDVANTREKEDEVTPAEGETVPQIPSPLCHDTTLEVESTTDITPGSESNSISNVPPLVEVCTANETKIDPGPSHANDDTSSANTCNPSQEKISDDSLILNKTDGNETNSACSSMEIDEELTNNHVRDPEEPLKTPNSPQKQCSVSDLNVTKPQIAANFTTLKNDPEECSVSSTTAIDPRREKTTEDESDEQNSMQDTVTDSSSNNDGVNKNWIQGALLNLFNPDTIDKMTVLNMLEKVVDSTKFQQIKAIIAAEEDKKTSNGAKNEAGNDVKPEANSSEESTTAGVSGDGNKQNCDSKPHSKPRKTELDRLNEDIRHIIDGSTDLLGLQSKRACTENKTPNYCEIGPDSIPKQPATKDNDVIPPIPKKKKKKKKYEVFSYRTRRRSKRKKPKIPAIAALAGIDADGTESSLGGEELDETGDDNLLEELQGIDEINNDDNDSIVPSECDIVVKANTKESISEAERKFKNIHPEMHSLSKYVSTCAICNFSGRYVTTHYMNSHRMTEMVVSRLPPSSQERLMRGEGMDSVFTGKDPFQNRVYQHVCPFCCAKKSYARKIWSQHFGSHTGEYKYKCSSCGYMSVNVRGHIMKYCPGARPIMLENLDRGQDILAYICKLCNYIQMNRDHVVNHIENQHEITGDSEELITEVTLFRSDLRNLHSHGAVKKQRSIEVTSTALVPATKPNVITIETSNKSEDSEQSLDPDDDEDPQPTTSYEKFQMPKSLDGKPLKNIYPYIHSQSEYISRCVLCNYTGKFITKHYVKEHSKSEVFVARIPPDRQACILNNQQLTKLGPVTVVKYKNYYRHSACPFCTVEKSSQRFDWVMHFAIHTGEYKFRCTSCNHCGNARNEFARHFKNGCPNGKLVRLWSHYKYNEEDPVIGYFCKLCNFIQMSRKNIVRHLKTQHDTDSDEILKITLFSGNPRYKGRRSVKGGGNKKGKRAKRKIKHVLESGIINVPDFICDGVVDEEFMAEEGMMDETMKEDKDEASDMDDDLELPMHKISNDFGDGFENLFQMEMSETGAAAIAATAVESTPRPSSVQISQEFNKDESDVELIRPPEDPIQNIHPEMHSLSPYASKCLLCNFAGKYIAKHYVEEHTDNEVFASRLSPEGQKSLISGEGSMPIKCVIRSRKMNYFFACPFCKLERDCTRHNWVAHFAIHTGEYKYQCSQCSHRGNASRDFKRHFKGSCRFAQQIRRWPDLVSKEEPILGYYCNLCNFIQLDRNRILKHLSTQHKCYESLVSKIILLFIDPMTQMESALAESAPVALPAALQSTRLKVLRRKFGKHGKKRRPISKMWSTHSQKRAQLQRRTELEEENEDNDENPEAEQDDVSDGDFDDDGDVDCDENEKSEDVIEVMDSDDEKPSANNSNSATCSYEKIKKFIERTEHSNATQGVITIKKEPSTTRSANYQIPLPFEAPTKDRPLSNVHADMHSLSVYAKKCILCPFVGRHLINHYISFHPRFEVPISRLPPSTQKLLEANKSNIAKEIEANAFSPKLFSHTCMFCDTEFTFTIKSWVDHIGTHTGEYNFKCSECGRMINSKHDIIEHIKHFCRKGKPLARQFPVTDKQQLLAHVCKLCNFIQMNRGNIVQHLRVQHKAVATVNQIIQVTLLRFGEPREVKPETKDVKVPILKKDERIKVENADTKYTTREFVKVEQSDAIYEIIVPKTEHSISSEQSSNSSNVKNEMLSNELSRGGHTGTQLRSYPGMLPTSGLGKIRIPLPAQQISTPSLTIRRSASTNLMNNPASSVSNVKTEPDGIHRISHLGYSQNSDGTTKYHCCVRSCTFAPSNVPITLATHIMDYHASIMWEGYCRECQGHVATGKNMKLTKEIQHLFEHTRKRPASVDSKEDQSLMPPLKIARRSDSMATQHSTGISTNTAKSSSQEDCADQIIARFANNKSITITREVKSTENDTSATLIPSTTATSKQQQVLKEAKRTALKPWTVSKSIKSENTVHLLLSDISLFAFFKCMGNDCQFTTNDSNKMATHLTLHSERAALDNNDEDQTNSNVFSWSECCYCSTWAGTVMQLIAHITAKHSRDIYQCPYCFYRSCEEYNVVTHEKHYHLTSRLSILLCFGRRLLKPGGDIAIGSVKKTKCNACTCTFMNPIAYATHVAEYTDVDLGGDIYKCYYCSKKHTKSIIEFARHIVEHRPTKKAESYKCYKCCKRQITLTQQLLPSKNNIKAYQCVHCAYSTDDEFQMGLHMAQVHASNLLFCGLRIRSVGLSEQDVGSRHDNGAAFVALKKRVDGRLLYKCPYTPTQLNYMETALQPPLSSAAEDDDDDEQEGESDPMDKPTSGSPVITQNPGGLKIAQVESITNTQFESFITIDDDDDDD